MLLATLLATLAPCASPAVEGSVALFALTRTEDGPVLETLELSEGETLELVTGAGHDLLAVVLPPASLGISGELLRGAEERSLVATLQDGDLVLAHAGAGDGARELARVPVEDLQRLEVRVSAVDAQGAHRSWIVRGWREAAEDEVGPGMDLFAGLLPLAPGDLVLTTETRRRPTTNVAGTAPLVDAGEHVALPAEAADGSAGWFLVDTSASATVVARDFLAEETEIVPATMVERSAGGVRTLDAGMTGATGEVGGLLGEAHLDALTLGGLRFGAASVRVLEDLPSFGGRRLLGILGLDLLRRAERVSLRWPRGDERGQLALGPGAAVAQPGEVVLPMSVAAGLPFVRGELAGQPVRFAVDTGSRFVFVASASAERLQLELDAERSAAIRGLGAEAERAPLVVDPRLIVGSRAYPDLAVHAADLPVFARLARGCDLGVLGLPCLRSWGALALDFEAGELTLAP